MVRSDDNFGIDAAVDDGVVVRIALIVASTARLRISTDGVGAVVVYTIAREGANSLSSRLASAACTARSEA